MRIRPHKLFLLLIILIATLFAFAEGTRTWEQAKFEDLSKGTATGIAIRSAGGLELAPAFKAIATTPSTYIWAIAAGPGGDLYAATGTPARVFRITQDGQSTAIFEPQELQVQALVVDKNGVIYAATNPDGKVYRLEPGLRPGSGASETRPHTAEAKAGAGFSSSVYFDPGTKYIWDLALDDSGNLYVATGDKGEIFRVTPKGEHSVFFKSDETHIRVLALDAKGNLIAGSDGSGLIYRISPKGEGFVLYSAPKKEITALALDASGNIFAAGAGEKRAAAGAGTGFVQALMSSPIPTIQPTGPTPGGGIVIGNPNAQPTPASIPFPGAGATTGSEIYRIAPDGSPTRIWNSREDLVYALDFDSRGRLLAGTGNRGHIYAITGDDQFTDLVKASANQVTAFAKAPAGGLYVSTSNLGKLFLLGSASESQGRYDSDVFDAHIFSRWGRLESRGTGNVDLFARSGNVDNPDRNWSVWQKVDPQKDSQSNVPPARFIQWRAVLHAGDPAPRLDSVLVNYLPKNVAPDFDDVTVQVGVRFQPAPKPSGNDISTAPGATPQPRFDAPPTPSRDRDAIGVKWSVHDDNDDQMVYTVYYRGDGDSRWLLLKDGLTDKSYSFDASLLPDGGYTVKVVASDAPSHSPDQALSAERESARFEVDTTPPRIENLTASVEGAQIRVAFRATDSFSPIKRAEYSVDASDWQFVEPVDQLSDSKTESYDFRVPVPAVASKTGTAGGTKTADTLEHVVVVRVYDRYDNMSSAKTVIRGR